MPLPPPQPSKLHEVFPLQPPRAISPTMLGEPRMVTAFSVSDGGAYFFGEKRNTHLSYFYRPTRALNGAGIPLNAGLDKWKETLIDERPPHDYRALLHAIVLHEKATGERLAPDIVGTRRVMKYFLQSVKSDCSTFELDLVYFDGLVFLEETPHSKARNQDVVLLGMRGLRSIFYGHKFESCVTLNQPVRSYPNARAIQSSLDHNYIAHGGEGYVAVVERKVKGITMVVSGEIDCVQDFPDGPEPALTPSRFIELKTTSDARFNFKTKIFRAWLQCVAIGTPTIVYGFQTSALKLKEMERFEVATLPSKVLRGEGCGAAVGQYVALLKWIMATVPRDTTKAWRLEYTQGRKLELREYTKGVEAIRSSVVTPEFQAWRTSGEVLPWSDKGGPPAASVDGLAAALGDLSVS